MVRDGFSEELLEQTPGCGEGAGLGAPRGQRVVPRGSACEGRQVSPQRLCCPQLPYPVEQRAFPYNIPLGYLQALACVFCDEAKYFILNSV